MAIKPGSSSWLDEEDGDGSENSPIGVESYGKDSCSKDNVATVPWQRCQKACWYFVTSRINPQAHKYRCSFHPRVFQGIVSTREREYTIYGFRLSKDTHTSVGG